MKWSISDENFWMRTVSLVFLWNLGQQFANKNRETVDSKSLAWNHNFKQWTPWLISYVPHYSPKLCIKPSSIKFVNESWRGSESLNTNLRIMVHYRNKAKQYNKETLKYDMPKNSGMTTCYKKREHKLQLHITVLNMIYNSQKKKDQWVFYRVAYNTNLVRNLVCM